MSSEEHGEFCWYLNEWLGIWNSLPIEVRRKGNWDYAQTVSATLSELLVLDATEAGL